MIKVENINVYNIENAIRGMRNAMQSWDKSDSKYIDCGEYLNGCKDCEYNFNQQCCLSTTFDSFVIGEKDMELAMKLVRAGAEHRKFLRQIFISMNITAPLYFWKEMDTYKVGTTANSTSTMHTLHKKKLTIEDFSFDDKEHPFILELIEFLNRLIDDYNEYKKLGKETFAYETWRKLIQLLPSSYNQMRTWTANYEVLHNIYHQRKNHKLVEWQEFCKVLEKLPYSQFITEGD